MCVCVAELYYFIQDRILVSGPELYLMVSVTYTVVYNQNIDHVSDDTGIREVCVKYYILVK